MPTIIPRAMLLACLCLAAVAGAQGGDGAAHPAAGVWRGAIEIPGTPLEVSVTLRQEDDAWSGTIDIPAQGATGLPLEDVAVDGDEVAFAIAATPGDPTFRGTLEGDEIAGTFSQSGQELPFTLARTDAEPASPLGPAAPAAPAEPAPEGRYEDPQGRFRFPIPTGWRVVEEDGRVRIEDPEGGIRVHVVTSGGEDLEAAIAEAWSRVDPAFDLEPDDTLEPPSDPGVERTVVANYDPDDDERVLQAVAQLHEGTVYTLLIDADLAALQRRAAQLQIVASGFEIAALEETDLTGAEPRAVRDVVPELEAFVEENLEAFGVPGAAIAIVEGDEIVHAAGFGTTRAEGGEPVTPSTHMMIGSTGKTMTSMLVATLVDDGVVDWDTPVVEVLPGFAVADPELSETITLRNLLCACTGVPRRDFEFVFNADELSAEAIVDSLGSFEFFTDFGEAFQYSNQLVATAGYAAAAAAGAERGELFDGYAAALRERVLDPIGLDRTTLSFEEVRERDRYAVPHQQSVESGAYEPIDLAFEEILLPVAPAGAHWSTAEDMGRYMATLLNAGVAPDGERVVSEENLRVTWEPQVPVSATDSYGLGWLVGEYKGLEWIHHAGNTLGFTSEFVFVPEADVGIVVLANAQGSNAFNGLVATRLFELLYDVPSEAEPQAEFQAGESASALGEAREQLQDRVDPEEVEPFLGRYANEALGEIALEMDDGRLMLDAGEFRTEVRPLLDRSGEFDTYVTYGVPITGLPIAFETDAEGADTVVLGQGAVAYTFERVE